MKATWSEQKVIEFAGFRMEDANDTIITMAGIALERCYYIDRAAEELLHMLNAGRRLSQG